LTVFGVENSAQERAMANLREYEKLTVRERQNRYFGEEFRRRKVSEIERGVTTIAEVSREYQLTRSAIYKWIQKYSRMRKKQERMVVESLSDTRKIAALKERVKELERMVGQKQIQIDFFDKMIELAEEEYGIDIKKNSSTPSSAGTGRGGKNTDTK
jgi:transposase-like protein